MEQLDPTLKRIQPNPLHFYAKSKLESERIVQKIMTKWSIARTIIIYGITDNMSRSNISSLG